MFDIDELTLGQARELANLFGNKTSTHQPFDIGEAYLIRTVTHYSVGVVVEVGQTEIVMHLESK